MSQLLLSLIVKLSTRTWSGRVSRNCRKFICLSADVKQKNFCLFSPIFRVGGYNETLNDWPTGNTELSFPSLIFPSAVSTKWRLVCTRIQSYRWFWVEKKWDTPLIISITEDCIKKQFLTGLIDSLILLSLLCFFFTQFVLHCDFIFLSSPLQEVLKRFARERLVMRRKEKQRLLYVTNRRTRPDLLCHRKNQ